jgi:transitional endoplasmic reticulum ATPase
MTTKTIQLIKPTHDQQDESSAEVYRAAIQVWILRILLDLNGYRRVGVHFNIDAEELTNFLELDTDSDEDPKDSFVPLRLATRLRNLESNKYEVKGTFSANVKSLSRALALSPVEEGILEFLLLLHRGEELGEVADLIGSVLTHGDLVESLAVILDIPKAKVNEAIKPDAILFTSGLVRMNSGPNTLRSKLKVLPHLIDAVSVHQEHPLGVLAQFLDQAPAPRLVPEDFEDYCADYDLLKHYLKGALKNSLAGCNILIHGMPGVGKTQIVRTLCDDLGADLYEVSAQDRNKEPLSRWERLSVFQLSQQMLAKRDNTVLLFDEIEDVFPDTGLPWLTEKRGSNSHKSWFNQQLETNQLPVFWLANDVSQLNSAYVRRFDIVLELRPMRAKARSRLIKQAFLRAGVTPGPWISQAAENKYLSPALIENITRVMAQTSHKDDESEIAIFEKLANGTLNAMGFPLLNLTEHTPTLTYKVNLLNVDTDLEVLLKGLMKNREGRLLCYGPPGTGKTAFARYMAKDLDIPLLQFRASDILGPYVGMTEQNLAGAFRQAKEEGAVMLLDEIDSLLRSRDNANHSWEVTQVNELLMQMENYQGILVACTNHKSTLDNAAARRFDLKIEFGYLEPERAWDFFQVVLKSHKIIPMLNKQAVKARIHKLKQLTPGDFRTTTRKLSLTSGGVTALGLIEGLEDEVQTRSLSQSREIGFSAVF